MSDMHTPAITPETEPFWSGVRDGVVMYQRCLEGDEAIFPPRTFCPYCLSTEIEWCRSSGAGTLYTFTEMFVPASAAHLHRIPYVLGFVEMDEGFFLFGQVLTDPDDLTIGMRTRATTFDRDGLTLLAFEASS